MTTIKIKSYKFILTAIFLLLSSRGLFSYSNQKTTSSFNSISMVVDLGNIISLGGLLVLFLISIVIIKFRFKKFSGLKPLNYYIGYLVVCILSALLSYSFMVSFGKLAFLITEFLIITVMLSLIYADVKKNNYRIQIINDFWDFSIKFLYLFLVVVLIAWLTSPAFQMGEHIVHTSRMAGGKWFYWAPNFLSQISTIVLLISIFKILSKREFLMSPIMMLIAGYILFETQSRTSLIALLIGLIIMPFITASRSAKNIGIVSIIGFVFFIPFLIDSLQLYVLRGQNIEQFASGTGRFSMYLAAFDLFLSDFKSFFIGQGYYVGSRVLIPSMISKLNLSNLDNTYLEAALNSGVFALMFLMATVITTLSMAFKRKNYKVSNNPEALLALIVVLVRSLSGPTFHTYGFELLILMIVSAKLHLTKCCEEHLHVKFKYNLK